MKATRLPHAMTLRNATGFVRLYNQQLKHIPGFLSRKQALVWGFLFELHETAEITGGVAEIGVFEGRSAVLLAATLRPDESLILVDPYESPEVAGRLANAAPGARFQFLARSSEDDVVRDALTALNGGIRFFHIDGRHDARSVRRELALATSVLTARGVVCVDDFFSTRYPEVTQGVFDFLRDCAAEVQLVLVAFNKCYLCRSEAHAFYLDALGRLLLPVLRTHEFPDFTLFRSHDAEGLNCYSLGKRLEDHDTYGPDGTT